MNSVCYSKSLKKYRSYDNISYFKKDFTFYTRITCCYTCYEITNDHNNSDGHDDDYDDNNTDIYMIYYISFA